MQQAMDGKLPISSSGRRRALPPGCVTQSALLEPQQGCFVPGGRGVDHGSSTTRLDHGPAAAQSVGCTRMRVNPPMQCCVYVCNSAPTAAIWFGLLKWSPGGAHSAGSVPSAVHVTSTTMLSQAGGQAGRLAVVGCRIAPYTGAVQLRAVRSMLVLRLLQGSCHQVGPAAQGLHQGCWGLVGLIGVTWQSAGVPEREAACGSNSGLHAVLWCVCSTLCAAVFTSARVW